MKNKLLQMNDDHYQTVGAHLTHHQPTISLRQGGPTVIVTTPLIVIHHRTKRNWIVAKARMGINLVIIVLKIWIVLLR